jgi:hypothetical protein
MDHRPVRPNFDVTEEYLIASYRKSAGKKLLDFFLADMMFLLVGLALFLFGLRDEDFSWCLVGFGLLAFRMIQWIIVSYQYGSAISRVFEKYEQAFRAAAEPEMKSE